MYYITHVIGFIWSGSKATYKYTTNKEPLTIATLAGDFARVSDYQVERVSYTTTVEAAANKRDKIIETKTTEIIKPWSLDDSEYFYMNNAA
jgi:hypothetical protein